MTGGANLILGVMILDVVLFHIEVNNVDKHNLEIYKRKKGNVMLLLFMDV